MVDERIAELNGWRTVAESNQQMAQSWQARAERAEAELAEMTRRRDELRKAITTEPTDAMLASACMWHNHRFGLWEGDRQREWILVAREWWRATVKEIRHRAAIQEDQ